MFIFQSCHQLLFNSIDTLNFPELAKTVIKLAFLLSNSSVLVFKYLTYGFVISFDLFNSQLKLCQFQLISLSLSLSRELSFFAQFIKMSCL